MESPNPDELVIGPKALIAIVAIPLVAIAGVIVWRTGLSDPPAAARPAAASAAGQVATSPSAAGVGQSDLVGGVEGHVKDVRRTDGTTVVVLVLSNHAYDLADPTLAERTELAGVKPSGFEVLESYMGGHHVTVSLSFEGDLNGDLTVGAAEDAVLKFSI